MDVSRSLYITLKKTLCNIMATTMQSTHCQTTRNWGENNQDMTNVSNQPPHKYTSRVLIFTYSKTLAWLFHLQLRYIRLRCRHSIQNYLTILHSPDQHPHRSAESFSPLNTSARIRTPFHRHPSYIAVSYVVSQSPSNHRHSFTEIFDFVHCNLESKSTNFKITLIQSSVLQIQKELL